MSITTLNYSCIHLCIYINILLLNNNHSFFVGVFFLGDLASDFLGDLVGDIYGSSSLA